MPSRHCLQLFCVPCCRALLNRSRINGYPAASLKKMRAAAPYLQARQAHNCYTSYVPSCNALPSMFHDNWHPSASILNKAACYYKLAASSTGQAEQAGGTANKLRVEQAELNATCILLCDYQPKAPWHLSSALWRISRTLVTPRTAV